MHLGIPALLEFFDRHRGDDALVLATIIDTAGSTYRKPGAMMLIGRDGTYAGLISGGCLEGDLLHHAARVFESGSAVFVTYDMHADDELVWNLGLGCDGVIHLMLQRLDRVQGFGFLSQLAELQGARRAALLALAIGQDDETPAGAFGILDPSNISEGSPVLRELLAGFRTDWPRWRYRHCRFGPEGQGEAIVINLPAATRVLLCGGGPDAVPMAAALRQLDWEVHVADHRPAFARPERFPEGCRVVLSRPEAFEEKAGPLDYDAAVIMSHHLENDAAWLRVLATRPIPYLGVLGPRARRNRLLDMAGCPGSRPGVFGPVGLDIGAELPAAIALSVAAEIHAVLNERDGRTLTVRTDEQVNL